jgi:hypothetical protein
MQSRGTQHPCFRTLVLILSAVLLAELGAAMFPGSAQAGYVFTGGGTNAGVATGDAAATTLYLAVFGGLIYHSTDDAVYSPDWGGGLTIAAVAVNSVSIFVSTGAGSNVKLGRNGVLGPASSLQALINVNTTGNQVIIDDSSNTAAVTYVQTFNSLTAPGINISFNGPAIVNGRLLQGSIAGSVYNINSTFGGEPVTVNGGAGNDTFNIIPANMSSHVTIDGGPGVNTLDFTGATAAIAMTLNGGAVTGVDNVSATNIQSIVGGDNSDTFTVVPSATIAYSINGGLPDPPTSPGDALIVDASGTTNPSFSSTSTPTGLQGSFTFGNRQPVNFQRIESLPGGAATHFTVSAPASATAGVAFNFTVTAFDVFNNIATGYGGTVHFTSTDAQATLPADSSLTNGTGTFSATLRTSGSQTITAVDTVNASIIGTFNIDIVEISKVPTITECGILTMFILLGGSGIYLIRRRRAD